MLLYCISAFIVRERTDQVKDELLHQLNIRFVVIVVNQEVL